MRCRFCTALVCLVVLGSADARAQKSAVRSFFSTLSFDTYAGGMYDWYHGYSLGVRAAVPLFTLPTLNGLFSFSDASSDKLYLLPGIKAGAVKAGDDPLPVRIVYYTPDVSLHYTFLRFSHLAFSAGPSLEFIYTNNYFKYKVSLAEGIDLGAMWLLSDHVQLGIEQRWIMHEENQQLMNAALFPRKPFSQLGLVVRFALPWESEEAGYESARALYEQKLDQEYAAQRSLTLSQKSAIDSLQAEVRALKSAVAEAQKQPVPRVRAESTVAVDSFNARIMIEDPEYAFTKDPFKAGNLVNDGYLKNVLIDILDDEYVWQLRTSKLRKSDAEKIRAWFVLYNSALKRRIVLAEDDTIPLFTLRCLGKASVPGN